MRTRRLILFIAALAMVAPALPAAASHAAQLHGDLQIADHAWVLTTHQQRRVAVDGGGTVTLTTGALRHVVDHRRSAPAVTISGSGLAPDTRHLVTLDGRPVLGVSTDSHGRVAQRFASVGGMRSWTPMPASVARQLSAPLGSLRVIAATNTAKDGGTTGYFAITPLCGDDPMLLGEALATDQPSSYFSVWARGLQPNQVYTVRANDIEIGSVPADNWGGLWLDASEDGSAAFTLPPELVPVSVIASVEVVLGDAVVLAGDFTDPCIPNLPPPPEAGTVELCSADGRAFGFFDWMILDDGLQMANLMAFELTVADDIDVSLDGIDIGSGTVGADGTLWMVFSTQPGPGELPLPPEVLPLDEVEDVVLASDGETVLEGTAGEPCSGGGGPIPVEYGDTPLCMVEGPPPPPGVTFGMAAWAIYENGDEELMIDALVLEPDTTYELVVDGHSLGTHDSGPDGMLFLVFSSAPGDRLPLPDEIRPVSGIDLVDIKLDGQAVLAGSFADPCDGWTPPPPPVDLDYTPLCSPDGEDIRGETGWAVYEDGTEELWVSAFDLDPGLALELVIDGSSLGTFTTDDVGGLHLFFSSDSGPGQLPLPDAVRPVSEIDLVSLLDGDEPVLAGSFSDPCDGWNPPPQPVDVGYTALCAEDGSPAWGDVTWMVFDNGTEELMVSADMLTPDASFELVVDGSSLGAWQADEHGAIFLSFSSDAQNPDQLPLPDSVRPVSEIDVVELRDDSGQTVLRGSFSDPCAGDPGFAADLTPLCATDGGAEIGTTIWWTQSFGGSTPEDGIEIVVWDLPTDVTYRAEIDGIDVGELAGRPWGGDDILYLNLGAWGDLPIPDELRPVSDIDVIWIIVEDGTVAAGGSFSNPCGSLGEPVEIPAPQRDPMTSAVR